jgi:hypothetical protein
MLAEKGGFEPRLEKTGFMRAATLPGYPNSEFLLKPSIGWQEEEVPLR